MSLFFLNFLLFSWVGNYMLFVCNEVRFCYSDYIIIDVNKGIFMLVFLRLTLSSTRRHQTLILAKTQVRKPWVKLPVPRCSKNVRWLARWTLETLRLQVEEIWRVRMYSTRRVLHGTKEVANRYKINLTLRVTNMQFSVQVPGKNYCG